MTSLINIEEYKKSLKEASYDDAKKISMFNDTREQVYILDDLAKKIEEIFQIDRPSSCDSVVIKEDSIYLIEFKNRDYSAINSNDKREIRKKAYQSREILLSSMLKDKTIQYVAEHVKLLVVFKTIEDKSKSFEGISSTLNRLANGSQREIKCKLSKFQGTFYKEVHTISMSEFEKEYMPVILE